jgi:phospholipase/lecithinase/hemolysin
MRAHLTAWLLISLLLATTGAWAAFSSIYVFGDSLS